MKLTLGVDPGTRNTGIALMNESGKVVDHFVIVTPRDGLEATLKQICEGLRECLEKVKQEGNEIVVAAVERVVWQGRPRKIMLPLAHVAGMITGFLLCQGVPVYLIPPTMRKYGGRPIRRRKGITEHEHDAAQLARIVFTVELAASSSTPRWRGVVDKLKISAPNDARG